MTREATGGLRLLRGMALGYVLMFAIQRLLEQSLPGWPLLIGKAPLSSWGIEPPLRAEFSTQTAIAQAAIGAALLSESRYPRLSTAATLFSALVTTIAIQGLAFQALLTDLELSVFSVGLMLLLSLDLMHHKRDQRPFSGLMCPHGQCQLVRALTLAAIMIPSAVGLWLAKTLWMSAHIAHGLEIAFGLMSMLLVGLTLWVGDLMRSQNLEMELAAISDPLTRIRNRRGVLQAVKTWHYSAMILIDLDRLKWLNDTFGHEIGDEAIQLAATILEREIGEHGIVGRWGGDEFIVLLDKSAAKSLHETCNRLDQALARGALSAPTGETISLSASFGPAAMTATLEGFNEARERADRALYHGKACKRCQRNGHACAEAVQSAIFHMVPPSCPMDRLP
ncbi:GGDEF domain-containing protein [Celeribacter neptunius]|uniref:GGDEF domain-containing protein n=1 Tax=Celeribacter neptunius TaxID=588602 RepID=UPI0015A5D979|nr:GGDEF domain-containing protein [Celeribacter neptunius]